MPGRSDRGIRAADRPAALNEGYGLSETSPVTHSTPQLAVRKPGTIGLPLPDTDMKIVDVETGTRELPVGEAGELCISGPQVMKGYWKRAGRDARSVAARWTPTAAIWFHTGDIARMDEDGYTSIVQRKKDLIIVDGFNVYPSDVETVLYTHPAVRLAAVIGIPDPYHGEVVKACVVLQRAPRRRPATTCIAHCRKRSGGVQGAARDRDPRDAADERRRQDPLPRAARRTRQVVTAIDSFRKMVAGELPPPPILRPLGAASPHHRMH